MTDRICPHCQKHLPGLPQTVGTNIPPSLPKGWTQEHAAKAAWMINTLAVTPPDEWRTKAELYETLGEFRLLSSALSRPNQGHQN